MSDKALNYIKNIQDLIKFCDINISTYQHSNQGFDKGFVTALRSVKVNLKRIIKEQNGV